MSDILTLTLAWSLGASIGAVFYGGLWWTVNRGMASPNPALLFFASMQLRMGLALCGFYLAMRGGTERLLLCTLGFVSARLVVNWLIGPAGAKCPCPVKEVNDAP